MSAFDTAFQAAHAPLQAYFGDRLRLTPIAPVGTGKARYVVGTPDPARAPRILVGIFAGDPIAAKVTGAGANARTNAEVETARFTVAFAAADFPDQPPPVVGDLVDAVDAADRPIPGRPGYRIVLVEPDGVSEIVCHLVERGIRDTTPP